MGKFTAAACGADSADRPGANWSSEAERCSVMREDCHQNFSTKQTNTTSTCITLQKKEIIIIQPLSKTNTFFSSSLSALFFPPQLLYKLTSSCATNCLSLSRYCP